MPVCPELLKKADTPLAGPVGNAWQGPSKQGREPARSTAWRGDEVGRLASRRALLTADGPQGKEPL